MYDYDDDDNAKNLITYNWTSHLARSLRNKDMLLCGEIQVILWF